VGQGHSIVSPATPPAPESTMRTDLQFSGTSTSDWLFRTPAVVTRAAVSVAEASTPRRSPVAMVSTSKVDPVITPSLYDRPISDAGMSSAAASSIYNLKAVETPTPRHCELKKQLDDNQYRHSSGYGESRDPRPLPPSISPYPDRFSEPRPRVPQYPAYTGPRGAVLPIDPRSTYTSHSPVLPTDRIPCSTVTRDKAIQSSDRHPLTSNIVRHETPPPAPPPYNGVIETPPPPLLAPNRVLQFESIRAADSPALAKPTPVRLTTAVSKAQRHPSDPDQVRSSAVHRSECREGGQDQHTGYGSVPQPSDMYHDPSRQSPVVDAPVVAKTNDSGRPLEQGVRSTQWSSSLPSSPHPVRAHTEKAVKVNRTVQSEYPGDPLGDRANPYSRRFEQTSAYIVAKSFGVNGNIPPPEPPPLYPVVQGNVITSTRRY